MGGCARTRAVAALRAASRWVEPGSGRKAARSRGGAQGGRPALTGRRRGEEFQEGGVHAVGLVVLDPKAGLLDEVDLHVAHPRARRASVFAADRAVARAPDDAGGHVDGAKVAAYGERIAAQEGAVVREHGRHGAAAPGLDVALDVGGGEGVAAHGIVEQALAQGGEAVLGDEVLGDPGEPGTRRCRGCGEPAGGRASSRCGAPGEGSS